MHWSMYSLPAQSCILSHAITNYQLKDFYFFTKNGICEGNHISNFSGQEDLFCFDSFTVDLCVCVCVCRASSRSTRRLKLNWLPTRSACRPSWALDRVSSFPFPSAPAFGYRPFPPLEWWWPFVNPFSARVERSPALTLGWREVISACLCQEIAKLCVDVRYKFFGQW